MKITINRDEYRSHTTIEYIEKVQILVAELLMKMNAQQLDMQINNELNLYIQYTSSEIVWINLKVDDISTNRMITAYSYLIEYSGDIESKNSFIIKDMFFIQSTDIGLVSFFPIDIYNDTDASLSLFIQRINIMFSTINGWLIAMNDHSNMDNTEYDVTVDSLFDCVEFRDSINIYTDLLENGDIPFVSSIFSTANVLILSAKDIIKNKNYMANSIYDILDQYTKILHDGNGQFISIDFIFIESQEIVSEEHAMQVLNAHPLGFTNFSIVLRKINKFNMVYYVIQNIVFCNGDIKFMKNSKIVMKVKDIISECLEYIASLISNHSGQSIIIHSMVDDRLYYTK